MEAYAHCESITRAQAANFYYGIRLLPRDRRRAMCAVYAFARRIDDIGDGDCSSARRSCACSTPRRERCSSSSARASDAAGADPVMVALADAHERFSLPPDALGELIEGVRMDVCGITYESFDELSLYCRRVAGAIGRLCLAIFGCATSRSAAQPSARRRPRRGDAAHEHPARRARGRRERPRLPAGRGSAALRPARTRASERDAPAVAGIARGAGEGTSGCDGLHALVRFEADRARQWFDRGLALAPLLDRRSAACVLAMAGIYRRLLDRIEAHPERALRERISLPVWEKALGGGCAACLGGERDERRRVVSS